MNKNQREIEKTKLMQVDRGFSEFLVSVTTTPEQIKQVWLSEAWAILQLLWQIYQLIKNRNTVVKWWAKFRTRRALRHVGSNQEVALKNILSGL